MHPPADDLPRESLRSAKVWSGDGVREDTERRSGFMQRGAAPLLKAFSVYDTFLLLDLKSLSLFSPSLRRPYGR